MNTKQLRNYIEETRKPYMGVPASSHKTNHTLDLLLMIETLVDKVEQLEEEQKVNNFLTAFIPFSFFTKKSS